VKIRFIDSYGWPLELYVNSPIKNFIRIVGMLILGRAKPTLRKRK